MWIATYSCSLNSCFVSLSATERIHFACICKKFAVFRLSHCLCSGKCCRWLPTYKTGPSRRIGPHAVSRRVQGGSGVGALHPVNHRHGPAWSTVSDIELPGEGQKTVKYLQMHANLCHFYCVEGHETWMLGTWTKGLSYVARFFRLRWVVSSEIERKRLNNRPGRGQPARSVCLEWRQGRFCVRYWGRGARTEVTQLAQVICVIIDKPKDARLRN